MLDELDRRADALLPIPITLLLRFRMIGETWELVYGCFICYLCCAYVLLVRPRINLCGKISNREAIQRTATEVRRLGPPSSEYYSGQTYLK